MIPNSLYLGDNLRVLREFPAECVDLVYLDPPFNSKRDYNYVFRSEAGADDTAHVKAFTDTWSFEGAAEAYHELIDLAEPVSLLPGGLRQTFGETSLLGYLSVMALRLRELRRVLRPTGSLYLHCDPTASHYLKMVLDAVFGAVCYRAEIAWKRHSSHGNVYGNYGRVHDIILFYGRGDAATWHQQFTALDGRYVASFFRHVEEGSGRRYRLQNVLNPSKDRPNLTHDWNGHVRVWKWTRERMQGLHESGRLVYSSSGMAQYKRYLDEMPGTPVTSVWTDIPPINSQDAERLGYPTQKPLALLERIVAASSNPGDLVLDPFCGCGTAVAAAQKLGRKWVGIDITLLAVRLIQKRMTGSLPSDFATPRSIPIHGIPEDVASARAIAHEDPYLFEEWVLEEVEATPPSGGRTKKRGADRGIDGVITWTDGKDMVQRCLISVKSGHTGVAHLHALRGVIEREGAAMGLLVTLEPPTKPMRDEAAGAGRYKPEGVNMTKDFPRLQIATVEQLLEGHDPDLPRWRSSPHKEAQAIDEEQAELLDG